MIIAWLRFAGELPAALVIAVALVSAALVIWLYSRESSGLDSPYNYLLPALRGSAVAMVILIPIFSGIKVLKAVKLAKKAKIAKYGFKAADKTQRKIRKRNKKNNSA